MSLESGGGASDTNLVAAAVAAATAAGVEQKIKTGVPKNVSGRGSKSGRKKVGGRNPETFLSTYFICA